MTKLIFVNRYFYPDHSATSQMLTDLAFALAEHGEFEIHIVATRQRYDNAKAALAAREEIRGVRIHRVWTSRFGRQNLLGRTFDYLSFYFTAFFALLALAEKQSIIVAKTDPPLVSVVAALAAKMKSARLINWIQDLFPEVAAALGVRFAKGALYVLLKWMRNKSLRAAQLNVVIGDLMKQRLADEGVADERICVIHNWADCEQIKPICRENNPLRKEWGLEGKFVVGYSGNFGRSHDFTTILEAATALNRREDIVFLFVGGGAHLAWLEREANARGLKNIVFKPYQPRVLLAESLSAADLHLITLKSELEGLIVPSKYYGIAAAGRAAVFVGSAEGQIAQLLRDSNGGTTVPVGDAAGLKMQIELLAGNRELCMRQGFSGRQVLELLYCKSRGTALWYRELLLICRLFGERSVAGCANTA